MDGVLAGRYELEVPLGRGGAGEVWRGRDMVTHRPVAIKLVELSLIEDSGLVSETIGRFRREAAVISGLNHPNIVGAIDAGRVGSQLFMVMELAAGISLAAMMDERGARGMGLFPLSSVLRVAEQVCAGLGAAHAAGIVHRDIKPSNLMVTPSLGIKIIDFGIARLLADNSPRLALPAQTVTTIAYMSPEQAQGADADGRADLYALGCVLYQLLSGHPPFFSTLPSALLMMQVMDRAVPLGNVRPDLPLEVCQLVSDLMEKDREARPPTAEEVIGRIAVIRDMLDDEAPEFEADRQTIGADARLDRGATQIDPFSTESVRSTVLTPERMAQLSVPDTMSAGPLRPTGAHRLRPTGEERWRPTGERPWRPTGERPWRPTGGERWRPTGELPWRPTGERTFRPSTPFQEAYPPGMPGQPSPTQSVPQATSRTGAGQGVPAPRLPAAPPPRRRRRYAWPAALSSVLAVAVVLGAGAYYWTHIRGALKITNLVVTTTNPTVGCNGTANLVGTITTNGHSGPVRYQWILSGAKQRASEINAGSGDTVQVKMSWHLKGTGTRDDLAELDILSQAKTHSSLSFPYSCPAK